MWNGILKNALGKKIFASAFGKKWTAEKVSRFLPFLPPNEKILDIGCGNGLISLYLQKKGFDVTALDVENLAYSEDIKVVVYDGKNIPFTENQFDTALLITVLHHTDNPEKVLQEAVKVAKKIVIIEDIYENRFQQYLTYFMDTLVNLGFSNMTYQNKSDKAWQQLFEDLSLEIENVSYKRVLFCFKQVTYLLKKLNCKLVKINLS